MKAKLWLCLPFVVVCLIDAGLTLAGQSPGYWQGERTQLNEVFPVFAWGLSKGPVVFAGICLVWMAFFSLVIAVSPPVVSGILALALVNGHTWGVMTWLVYCFQVDYHICLLFFVFTAALFVFSVGGWRKVKNGDL